MKPFSTPKKTLIIIALLVLGTMTLQRHSKSASAASTTIHVPDDYAKIRWAIGNATSGDTIIINSGTYHEHLVINKPLTLLGENMERTIIDGDGENQPIIEVTASNVVIKSFTVKNSSSLGAIKVSGNMCNITGNLVTQNNKGIFVTSQKTRIEKNVVSNNGQGIVLYSSSEVTVEANNATTNAYGISIDYSSNNTVAHNRVMNSTLGGYGITLTNSFNNTITSNYLVNNYHGMWLSGSNDNWIENNTIANNKLLGIELSISSDNTVYHNNLLNNGILPLAPAIKHITIDSVSISKWDYGYPFGGNYWHEYTNLDEKSGPNQDQQGSDQIWDNPYVINSRNKDNYPSIKPYANISSLIPAEEMPVAEAGPDQTVKAKALVHFDGSGSTGNATTYEWNFGDGTTGTGVTCSHAYNETGTYTVILTVSDKEGNLDADQLNVTIVENDQPSQINTSTLWVSILASSTVIVMLVAVLWKHKPRSKKRSKNDSVTNNRQVCSRNGISASKYSLSLY